MMLGLPHCMVLEAVQEGSSHRTLRDIKSTRLRVKWLEFQSQLFFNHLFNI